MSNGRYSVWGLGVEAWDSQLGAKGGDHPRTKLYRNGESSNPTAVHQHSPPKNSKHRGNPGSPQGPDVCIPSLDLLPYGSLPPHPKVAGKNAADPSTSHLTLGARGDSEQEKTPKQAPRRGGPGETGKCQGSPKPKCKNSRLTQAQSQAGWGRG